MLRKIIKTKRAKWAIVLFIIADFALVGSLSSGSIDGLPVALVLILAAVLLFMSAAKLVKDPSGPSSDVKAAGAPSLSININTSSSSYYVDRLIADGETMTLVDLRENTNPSGGFLNWSVYQIIGVNVNTKRNNKRQYEAKNEADAILKAEADGLTAPFEVTVIPHEEPTERQLEYLQSFGLSAPVGAKRGDISAILSRLEDATEVVSKKRLSSDRAEERVRPLPSPSAEFARFADAMGIMFSRYVGSDALFYNTVYSLNGRDRVAFYAHCVLCSYHRMEILDMRNFEWFEKLYAFADKVIYDQSFMRSIEGRSANDYLHPHRGAIAYKAVAEFFGLK